MTVAVYGTNSGRLCISLPFFMRVFFMISETNRVKTLSEQAMADVRIV